VLVPLSASHHPIQSLTFESSWASAYGSDLSFDGLNFNSVKKISFACLYEEQIEAIMNLALRSQHRHINLKFSDGDSITMELLRHELMQRVFHLDMSFDGQLVYFLSIS
jgi:hypothetical protein